MWCVAVGGWRCIYVTVLGPSPAEGVCGGFAGGAARVRTAFPTCAVYNAPQDGGYLMLDVVPMMLRALGVMCVSVWRVFAARRLNKSSHKSG